MEDYEAVYAYLNSGTYPTGFSKNQRRALRRKCLEHFKVSAGTLYFSSERKSSIKEGKERQWKTAVTKTRTGLGLDWDWTGAGLEQFS